MAKRIVDLRSDEERSPQAEAGLREAPHPAIFRICQGWSSRLPLAKYVVWTLDRRPGGGYRSGIYIDDRMKAQKEFDARQR